MLALVSGNLESVKFSIPNNYQMNQEGRGLFTSYYQSVVSVTQWKIKNLNSRIKNCAVTNIRLL